MDGEISSGGLWEIWFAIFVVGAIFLFVGKLRFGKRYYDRQEKRWLHSYVERKLVNEDEDGPGRIVKVRDLDAEARKEVDVALKENAATKPASTVPAPSVAPPRPKK